MQTNRGQRADSGASGTAANEDLSVPDMITRTMSMTYRAATHGPFSPKKRGKMRIPRTPTQEGAASDPPGRAGGGGDKASDQAMGSAHTSATIRSDPTATAAAGRGAGGSSAAAAPHHAAHALPATWSSGKSKHSGKFPAINTLAEFTEITKRLRKKQTSDDPSQQEEARAFGYTFQRPVLNRPPWVRSPRFRNPPPDILAHRRSALEAVRRFLGQFSDADGTVDPDLVKDSLLENRQIQSTADVDTVLSWWNAPIRARFLRLLMAGNHGGSQYSLTNVEFLRPDRNPGLDDGLEG